MLVCVHWTIDDIVQWKKGKATTTNNKNRKQQKRKIIIHLVLRLKSISYGFCVFFFLLPFLSPFLCCIFNLKSFPYVGTDKRRKKRNPCCNFQNWWFVLFLYICLLVCLFICRTHAAETENKPCASCF